MRVYFEKPRTTVGWKGLIKDVYKRQMTVYGTSGILPLRQWIDYAHRSLLLGDSGRLYSELAAS